MCQNLKEKIRETDQKILALINKRCELLKDTFKQVENDDASLYSPAAEEKIIENLAKINNGPLKPESLQAIYREIISATLALNHPLTVAFLGPEATFTHQAAIIRFGHGAKYEAKHSIADVFADVETKRADFGCVPIENTTEGTVNHTLDMFINSPVTICAELNMRIHHNLMSNHTFEQIKKVYSHAQVFGQCRGWIQEHLNGIELIETGSTTRAAQLAKKEDGAAAIASSLAAELCQLEILAQHIEDHSANTTRFMILGTQANQDPGENDKTSICFAIKDKVGALYECLVPFKEESITLTMIESRPSKRKNWEYLFFVDLLGHVNDSHVKRAITKLNDLCRFVKILGSYPRSTTTL